MEPEHGMTAAGDDGPSGNGTGRWAGGEPPRERTGPTWRGFVLSILVAIILSVMATLLLGGSWSSYTLRQAAAGSQAGCGSGRNCCPLPEEEGK